MSVWQNHDVERENMSRQNYTNSYESENKEEDAVNGEIVHNVALLLVEILGLAILLVANSYPHAHVLICSNVPISSYPHIIISSYLQILISSDLL